MLAADSTVSVGPFPPVPSTLRVNLTGRRFGRLVVLGYSHRNHRSQTFWCCHCDCGNTTTVVSHALLKGDTRSCGCLNRDVARARERHDLTGQRFGRLLVESMVWQGGLGRASCVCECGTHTLVYATNLTRRNTQSCGCWHAEVISRLKRKDLTPAEKRLRNLRNEHVRLARKHAAPTDFTRADAYFLSRYWQDQCAVCGTSDDFWHVTAFDHWIPLRSAQTLGTVPENIVPLCHARKGAGQLPGPPACNNSKGGKDPVVWLTTRLGVRKAAVKLREIEAYFAATRRRNCHAGV